jgi:hypothetical protein
VETFLKFSVSGEGRVVEVRKARRKTFQDSFLLAQKIGVKAAGIYEICERKTSSYGKLICLLTAEFFH